MSSKKLFIKKSKIQGFGIFASRDIKKGEVVCELKGKKNTISQIERFYLNGNTRTTCDTLQISEKTYLILDKFYNFINHSCEPNTGIKKICTLVALKDIKKNDEITYDYSAAEWTSREYKKYDRNEWPMRCKCDSVFCRRIIKCFSCLPKYLQKKYVESGVIQNFILIKLAKPINETRCYVCENVKFN